MAEIERALRLYVSGVAKAYSKATGLSMKTVSRKYYGNQGFLDDFKKGRQSITLTKLMAMLAALSRDWPAGAAWPPDVLLTLARPTPVVKKIHVEGAPAG